MLGAPLWGTCYCVCRSRESSPIDDRAIVGVVRLAILPVVAELVGHGVVVKLDAKAWAGGEVEITLAERERLLQVAVTQADLFLAEEVGNRRRDLDAGGQRDRA